MLPLKEVKVLDLMSYNGFCGMEMANYGAEVIKIERPGDGDGIRRYPEFRSRKNLFHAYVNHGKKSITLNLNHPDGQALFLRLVENADVVLENFRPGTMERWGLGYDTLSRVNPRLIYGALSAWGTKGPLQNVIGVDVTAQARGGIMDITGGRPPHEPVRVGAYLSLHYASTFLCAGIQMALYHARATGIGQRVDTSLLEALGAITEDRLAMYDFVDRNTTRTGNAHPNINPYDILVCKDGYLALAISTDEQWKKFCLAFDIHDWVENPKYASNQERGQHYFSELRPQLEELFRNYTCSELDKRCAAVGVPAAPCYTIEDACNNELFQMRNMVCTIDDPEVGEFCCPGKIIKFYDGHPEEPMKAAPRLGEHNPEIYAFLTPEERAQLETEHVI